MLRLLVSIGKAIAFFFVGLGILFLWLLGKTFQQPRIARLGANEPLVERAAELEKFQHRLL